MKFEYLVQEFLSRALHGQRPFGELGSYGWEAISVWTEDRNNGNAQSVMVLFKRSLDEWSRHQQSCEKTLHEVLCDHDWVTRREGDLQYCRRCPAMRRASRTPPSEDSE